MRFLLDENVSYRVAEHLKAAGHECAHVSDLGLTSTDDAVILERARGENWVLVTADHDFVQLRDHRSQPAMSPRATTTASWHLFGRQFFDCPWNSHT